MTTGPRVLIENACYHIITRGNQKQRVFLDDRDCRAYLSRLVRFKKRYGFQLYCYCLMPNHVHLIGQPKESENLAKFMHALNKSYSVFFNKRYKKVGHLWQDRFKSKVIIKDRYLLDCMQYIEMNPVRAELAKTVSDYEWASYKERILATNKPGILDPLQV